MKINEAWLKEVSACSVGVKWFKNQEETDCIKVIKKLIKEDKLDWANWTISRALSKENKIRYAIYAAEQVIDIFEKVYPKDKRPREAIQAAKNYQNDPTEEKRDAAWDARDAAWAARDARDAAWAAWAAWDAGDAAGDARDAMKTKIIKHGIKLLEAQ